MSSLQAPVSKILTWSCVDGPGNRLVLFLQGCNYNCITCHNPHTIGQCNDCGDCIPACPTSALSLVDGKIRFDANACTNCDACLRACPISANPMVQTYTVEDILALLRENADFLSGITISGGEATLHHSFIKALFSAIGATADLKHLTRFIDSNGHLGADGWKELLPVTDGVMLDIKAFDVQLHKSLTKRTNTRSLASARQLADAGKLYELRYLMIPGRTDTDAELDALADFVRSLPQPIRLRLNGFRTHGVRPEAAKLPALARDRLEAAAAKLETAGLGPVALPAI
ncbi:YjjW family glycine radical enzyme activase [Roseibium sp.]|uniref:YjjW family glycine radical enzyme activase n=1 Tax=Roseibium sp. TaxID=1936156 RepID=UPI003B5228C9